MIVFVWGPPRPNDLNFISRFFGKGLPDCETRAVLVRSWSHLFRLKSSGWFHHQLSRKRSPREPEVVTLKEALEVFISMRKQK